MLATGTVSEVLATLPAQPATGHINVGAPERPWPKFDDATVEESIAFIRKTGIAEFIEDRYAATKKKQGRPALFTPLALLVAMHLAVRDDRALLLTELRNLLLRRLTPTMQRMLNIKADICPRDVAAARNWEARTEAAVRRAFRPRPG